MAPTASPYEEANTSQDNRMIRWLGESASGVVSRSSWHGHSLIIIISIYRDISCNHTAKPLLPSKQTLYTTLQASSGVVQNVQTPSLFQLLTHPTILPSEFFIPLSSSFRWLSHFSSLFLSSYSSSRPSPSPSPIRSSIRPSEPSLPPTSHSPNWPSTPFPSPVSPSHDVRPWHSPHSFASYPLLCRRGIRFEDRWWCEDPFDHGEIPPYVRPFHTSCSLSLIRRDSSHRWCHVPQRHSSLHHGRPGCWPSCSAPPSHT